MRIVDEKMLAEFRTDCCRHCGRRRSTDPHHLFGRGLAGGNRLDVRFNLVSLCRECHTERHLGNEPTHETLLLYVAHRHNCLQDDLIAAHRWLKNLDKHSSPERIEEKLLELKPASRRLAREAMEERNA
mgnify:CR=1 FL=1